MNVKRWALASLAAFVILSIRSYVVNDMLLTDIYMSVQSVWRTPAEMASLAWIFPLETAIFSLVLVYIYTRGYHADRGGAGQGLRFGLLAGLLVGIPMGAVWYAGLPIPPILGVAWFLESVIGTAIAGLAIGAIYKA